MNLLIRYLTSLATHSSHARKGVAASEEMRKASRLLRREVGAPSGDHPPEPRGRKTPKMSMDDGGRDSIMADRIARAHNGAQPLTFETRVDERDLRERET